MIYLEIINGPEPLALGVYEFEFDKITIGRSKKNDLIFLEQSIPLQYLVIKFIQNQLVVQSLLPTSFFTINSKKVSGTLKLKPNDILSFGENQIRIIKSSLTIQSVDFSETFDEFNAKSPELKFALDFIEQVLVDLEKDSNV